MGFEPTEADESLTRFPSEPIRPLWQLSVSIRDRVAIPRRRLASGETEMRAVSPSGEAARRSAAHNEVR